MKIKGRNLEAYVTTFHNIKRDRYLNNFKERLLGILKLSK